VTEPDNSELSAVAANGIEANVDIVDLVRRDATRVPEPYELSAATSYVLVKVREDERLEHRDLESALAAPRRARGNATVHDPSDFAELTNRLAQPDHTTVWANVQEGTITAVINDHGEPDEFDETAGWRDHRVTLQLQDDEDWVRWHALDGKGVDQAAFADFIENVSHTILRPDAATMLEVATTMSASRSVEFKQGTRLQTGDVQLTCVENTSAQAGAHGNVEIPEKVIVRIAPWLGVEPVELTARLRWRINQGRLAIGYQLLRSDRARRDAFAQLVAITREQLDGVIPVLLGVAPTSLR
jgi:uncharacterized protein YfdQ (DUF2303 family)